MSEIVNDSDPLFKGDYIAKLSSKELSEFIDEKTIELIGNVEYFKDFLVMGSVWGEMEEGEMVCNKIIVYYDLTEDDYKIIKREWERIGLSLNKGSYSILKLNDSRKTIEELYKYPQMEKKFQVDPHFIYADTGETVEALVRCRPCELDFSTIAPVGRFAYYNFEENIIAVTNGCKSYDRLFADLACEYAHYELAQIMTQRHIKYAEKEKRKATPYKYSRKAHVFHGECAAYALCNLYGIYPKEYDFDRVNISWFAMKPWEIRDELEMILQAVHNIDLRMQKLLKEKYRKNIDGFTGRRKG